MINSLLDKKVVIIGGSSGIGLAVAKLFDSVSKQIPISRVAEIEDIAPAYLDIVRSTYITGTNIPINGGALLQTIK